MRVHNLEDAVAKVKRQLEVVFGPMQTEGEDIVIRHEKGPAIFLTHVDDSVVVIINAGSGPLIGFTFAVLSWRFAVGTVSWRTMLTAHAPHQTNDPTVIGVKVREFIDALPTLGT